MAKRYLFIVNPVSGRMKIKSALFDILATLSASGIVCSVVMTERKRHAREYVEQNAAGFDAVICSGGDGTLNEVISGLVSAGNDKIPVGYIPCGSTNDFAESAGIPTDVNAAAKVICSGRVNPIDVGMINSDRYFTYIASFGAFTSASYSAPQHLKNTLGHAAYIIEALKNFSKIKPIHARIYVDGKLYEDDYAFCSVSNSTSIGGIIKLKEDAVENGDGLFEVTLVRFPNTAEDFHAIVRGISDTNFSDPRFIFVKASDIIFSIGEKVSWTLDGECYENVDHAEISVLRRKINIFS